MINLNMNENMNITGVKACQVKINTFILKGFKTPC